MYLHGSQKWRPLNGRPGLGMAVSRRSGPAATGLAYGL